MRTNEGLIETPLGTIAVTWEDGILTGVELQPPSPARAAVEVPAWLHLELRTYFEDGSYVPALAVGLLGTAFQLRVWDALQRIPPGATVTYGALAEQLGTSPRAVGNACRANPCPIVVPCHRVVAKDGLGGFAGDTTGRKVAFKRWLLRHEGADPRVQRAGQGRERLSRWAAGEVPLLPNG